MESETNTAEVSCLSIGCPGQCYGPLADELPSHLDAVRAIAFHPTELCLASGGDDMTVKIWRVDVAGLASAACVSSSEMFLPYRRSLMPCLVNAGRAPPRKLSPS